MCGGLINRQVQGLLSEPASLIILGWLLTRRLGTQSAGFWSVMGWNLRCTARCLVPISRRNILPPTASSSLTGGPSTSMLPARLRLSSLLSPPIWLSYMGRVRSGFTKSSLKWPFAVTCPAYDSVPQRTARPQRLISRPADKPAEQERFYFHLNTNRAVRRHLATERALATQGLIKCKHYHRLRDQQGERRHDVTILTRLREEEEGSRWD